MNKVAIVTGASKGIGKSIAISLAKKGYSVVINYLSDADGALKVLEEVCQYSEGIITRCDVSNEEDVKNMVNETLAKYGHIDLLVNNAGIAKDMPFKEKTKEDFLRVLEVNLVGTFLTSKYVGNEMLKQGAGNIINISSNNGIDANYPESADYDASKAGVISLTHNLAKEYAPYIRVNAICPGWVNTDMNKNMDDEYQERLIEKIKLKRFAEPEEIASVVAFLASDDASYINDAIIRVDGGE